jgi:hypothetical protein
MQDWPFDHIKEFMECEFPILKDIEMSHKKTTVREEKVEMITILIDFIAKGWYDYASTEQVQVILTKVNEINSKIEKRSDIDIDDYKQSVTEEVLKALESKMRIFERNLKKVVLNFILQL